MRTPSQPPQFRYPYPTPENERQPEGTDFGSLVTPKTVVSLAVWLVMFGLGAGLSGLILFVIYQGQVNDLRSELLESQEELRKSLEERIQNAPAARESPSLNVSGEAATPPDPLAELVQIVAPAMVTITGRDSEGRPVSGSGFVVNNADSGTWVLTSYRLVAGVKDFNQLSVRHKNSELVGEVYETDPGRDLALVIYQVPAERSLRFSRVQDPKEGDQVWAIGSIRGQPYAAGVAAKLTSVTPNSLGIDVQVPEGYEGGPLIDADGRVLGVLSSSAGKATATSTPAASSGSATPVKLACQRVLRCPSTNRDPAKASPGASPSPGANPGRRSTPAPAPPPPAEPPPPPPAPGEMIEPPASNPNTADVPIG